MRLNNLSYMLLLAISIALMIQSCGITSTGVIYSERSIPPGKVKFGTVAIMPNRLPMNLQNSEKWRVFNWGVIRERFESEGYRVVDYNTSVDLFIRSGLPMEDTKVSRDKYAELAEELNADIIIIPYYGMSYDMTGCMMAPTNHRIAIGSFQFYLTDRNDFMARIDFDGDSYENGLLNIVPCVNIIYMISQLSRDPDLPYEQAFTEGINKGLDQFFMKYEGVRQRQAPGTIRRAAPAAPSEYDKYSKSELEEMKKAAVANKDYKKAAEIKKEIERRKK